MELKEYITSTLDRDFLMEALQMGLLRDTVEECFVRYDASAEEIISILFATLCPGFSFQKFLKAVPKNERTEFLSELLYHIYYGSFSLRYLANPSLLTAYLTKILAAKASEKTIRRLPSTELYKVCQEEYDEGSYRILPRQNSAPPLKANLEHYIEGIQMIGYALPTKGKDLSRLAWLGSVVEGLNVFCHHFKLKKKPFVLVFDQSEKKLFKKNGAYIKSLGYPVLHIDAKPILYLAKSLGIEGLVLTDGDQFGFGGARNAILLFTSLLKYYHEQNINLYKQDKKTIKKDFSDIVLKEKRTPPIVHMGDDDVHVPVSTIFGDALFAYKHQKEYFCRYGLLTGRKTVVLDTTFDINTVLTHYSSLVLQHPFQNVPFSHGMATILTKPRLCLNLPFGTEEAHFTCMHNYHSDSSEPAIHLSGYRFPQVDIPKNRFSGFADYLRAHYRYIHGMRLVVDLIDPTNRHKACILPWNKRKKPFKNLGEAIKYIVRPDTIRKMQMQFQKNLSELESTLRTYRYDPTERPTFASTALSALDSFTPNKNQPKELTILFEELVKDYAHFKQYLAGTRTDYGQTLTHSLALLTNSIENATFQKWLKNLD